MKKFLKRGSAEIVSLILAIVVIGGLALAVAGTISNQANANIEAGTTQQTKQMGTNYNKAVKSGTVETPTLSEDK